MKVKAYECRRVVHAQRYVVERDGLYASRKRIVGRDVRGRGPLLRLACRADVKECLVVFVVCGCLLLVVGVDGIDVIFGIEVDGLYAALECPFRSVGQGELDGLLFSVAVEDDTHRIAIDPRRAFTVEVGARGCVVHGAKRDGMEVCTRLRIAVGDIVYRV